MDRITKAFRRRRPSQSYEPLEGGSVSSDGTLLGDSPKTPFSWLEYSIFLLLGISMLWSWNMFLAAAPYFQSRFSSSEWLLMHFQSAIISVSTVTNLGSMILLTKLQKNASYPQRIIASLVLNTTCFTFLALSATLFPRVSADGYFAFLMITVFTASLATGLCQNGVFAYVTGFGVGEYTQAIMTGQAIAGVLPCIAQIASVLSVPAREAEDGAGQESPKSAFIYFMTATGMSVLALLAFLYLARRHRENTVTKRTTEDLEGVTEGDEEERQFPDRKFIPLLTLFKKLKWLALGIFFCFAVTMVYPVFTQKILSVREPEKSTPRLFRPATFLPLAFLFWNSGDLIGRLITVLPQLNLIHSPRSVFLISILRVLFIPLYLLCNIKGRGAVISSDAFYLFVVQLFFGATNGYVGSNCMMGASEWVELEEREAAGGFMGLMLCGGLTVGSLLSFAAALA